MAREEADIYFRFSRRYFLHEAINTMDVLTAAGERCRGAQDTAAVLAEGASSPF